MGLAEYTFVLPEVYLKWICFSTFCQHFLNVIYLLVSQAYGEGSGADCRRHVQKLNLLQGQGSELPLRSLEETVSAGEEENMGHQQAGNVKQQVSLRPTCPRLALCQGRDECTDVSSSHS